MGDLCIDEEIPSIPSPSEQIDFVSDDVYLCERLEYESSLMVCCDGVTTTSFFAEQFAFLSFVDDIIFRFSTLTSCINRCFIHFIEDLVCRDVDNYLEDPVVSYSKQHPRSPCDGYSTSSSLHSDAGANLSVRKRRRTNNSGKVPVYRSSEIVFRNSGLGSVPYIFRGLMLPIFGLRFALRLAFCCWKRSLFYVKRTQNQVQSLISRIQKTLRGSSDDIGWLQRAEDMPPVEDGTDRFRELLQDIRSGKHTLPNSFVYLLIPGLFSNLSPLYFVSTKKFFSKMGLACHIAKIHSEASVEHNAWELKQYIEELYWGSGKRVMLLGHSKGGVDAAAALSIYWSELKGKVVGLALVQSPYGGTPIASDILREGQIADKETRRIMELIVCKFIKGDMRALDDLTYEKRREFITKHKLPEHIPLVSFHSEASVAPSVLATMSHIAHAELPWLPFPSFGGEEEESTAIQAGRQVPVIFPIAAAMALSALHLQLRYGEKSDGLVTCRDAEVPGSVVVHPDRKLDHAWMVHSSWNRDFSEPDASEMCEALLTMLVEIMEKMKKQHKH
ncbi:hypothetical protein MKX01_001079 [Papaver californicum]|nr:hypothetical protein MKX01_001079 [Papaver californicum]